MSIWTTFSEEQTEKRFLQVPTPSAKRVKMGDSKPAPVEQKIEMLDMALSTKEFEVPGTDCNRQMLRAMMPAILGTPREERHAHQHEMAKMIRVVFEEEEARLQLRVAEQQAKLDGADTQKGEHEGIVKDAEAKLEAKIEEIKQLKLALAKLVATSTDAEVSLQEAISQQDVADFQQQRMTDEKNTYVEAQQNSFEVLKSGCDAADQKEHFAVLKKVLKKLKADPSLLLALSKALAKGPSDRGEFDELVVQEITTMFDNQLASLEKKLADGASTMPPLTKAVEVAQEAAAKAKEAKSTQAEAALGALAERKALEGAVREAKNRLEEHEPLMQKVREEHQKEEAGLHFYQKEVLGACTDLMEWQGDAASAAAE